MNLNTLVAAVKCMRNASDGKRRTWKQPFRVVPGQSERFRNIVRIHQEAKKVFAISSLSPRNARHVWHCLGMEALGNAFQKVYECVNGKVKKAKIPTTRETVETDTATANKVWSENLEGILTIDFGVTVDTLV